MFPRVWDGHCEIPFSLIPAAIGSIPFIYSITRYLTDLPVYMKSSSQSSARSLLLDAAMFSSVKMSSYAWSFCHFFSFHS